jgi:hypothetical protein
VVVGDQLLLLPGADEPVTVGPAGDDPAAAELQLRVRPRVRVRVNGAESLDDQLLEFP